MIVSDAEVLRFLGFPASAVDQDSASGQKVLYTTDTINFASGDESMIGRGTVRSETRIIDTIQNGVSLTMTENLTYTHLETDADAVEVGGQDITTISALNLAVDKAVKNYCGRNFDKEEGAIEYLDGDGSRELWLEDYPVSNVVLYVKTDDDEDFDDTLDLVDTEDYVVYPDTGRIYCYASFVFGHRNVKAVYTRGYSADDMPEDLKTLVCKTEIKKHYGRWKEESGGLKHYSVAGMTKIFEETGLSYLSVMILEGSYVKQRV